MWIALSNLWTFEARILTISVLEIWRDKDERSLTALLPRVSIPSAHWYTIRTRNWKNIGWARNFSELPRNKYKNHIFTKHIIFKFIKLNQSLCSFLFFFLAGSRCKQQQLVRFWSHLAVVNHSSKTVILKDWMCQWPCMTRKWWRLQ